ncbi:MAG: hypothetical protein ABR502_03675 [Chitinophagaceae bacterium]
MSDKLFDLRFVIGAFFSIVGLLILVYSFVATDESAQTINRGCGIVFILFGVLMIALSFRQDATDEILEHDGDTKP